MFRIGLFTDLHWASGIREGTRHCHLGMEKLRAAANAFRRANVQMVVSLGDLVDAAETPQEEADHLQGVVGELSRLGCPVRYVPGNHCVWSLSKTDFRCITGQAATWGLLRRAGWRLIFLDGCFRADGQAYGRRNSDWRDANLSAAQAQWLAGELQEQMPTLVFIHQRLDVEPPYGVVAASAVRQTLETSGCVRAVFQGHEHGGAESSINGISYRTLRAMVEGKQIDPPAATILELHRHGRYAVYPA